MPQETQDNGAPKQDATGTLINQASTEPKTEPKVETKSGTTEPSKAEGDDKSLLNQGDQSKAASTGAPEAYTDFTLPEGFEANPEVMTEATTVFKELGLPQASAQRLVDFYAKASQQAAEAPFKLWQDTQRAWVDQVKADPEIGGKLDQVKTTIAKAIDGLGDTKLASDFREAMDYTGAGNNPAFIRAFYRLAQKVTEGSHVTGQPAQTNAKPRSAAAAMYPNLSQGA